jgi:hypothetical protein
MLRIFLFLVLALVILTGCGPSDDEETTPVAQGTSTAAVEPTEMEAEPTEVEAEPTEAETAEVMEATEVPATTPTVMATDTATVELTPTVEVTMTASPEATEMATDTAGAAVSIGLELVAEGLTSPVGLVPAPDDSGRLFILDLAGVVYIVDEGGTMMAEPFLDVRDRMVTLDPEYDERGLLGLAFHPDFS